MIHLHLSLLLRMFSERIKDDCRLSAADLKPCDRFSRSSEMWLDLISFFIEPSGPLFTLQIILFSPCGLQVALFVWFLSPYLPLVALLVVLLASRTQTSNLCLTSGSSGWIAFLCLSLSSPHHLSWFWVIPVQFLSLSRKSIPVRCCV